MSSQELTSISRMTMPAPTGSVLSQLPRQRISDPQNSALAGVGSPMKPIVWRSSRLNFAKRRAEKAAMMYATNGR